LDVPPRRPYVGIDVSKARLDVALLPTGGSFAVSNDEEGFDEHLGRVEDPPPALVVLEASGGFERQAAAAKPHQGAFTGGTDP
jgi:transposase